MNTVQETRIKSFAGALVRHHDTMVDDLNSLQEFKAKVAVRTLKSYVKAIGKAATQTMRAKNADHLTKILKLFPDPTPAKDVLLALSEVGVKLASTKAIAGVEKVQRKLKGVVPNLAPVTAPVAKAAKTGKVGRPAGSSGSTLKKLGATLHQPVEAAPVKRGPGRPRKIQPAPAAPSGLIPVKRGPGRPRKIQPAEAATGATPPVTVKRGPGRPRKIQPTENGATLVQVLGNTDAPINDHSEMS